MPGYVCIAMLEDPPYNLYLAATEDEPEDWCAELPLTSHLLCYEGFKDPNSIVKKCIKQLKAEGIEAKTDKAFPAQPYDVIRVFIEVRDSALRKNKVVIGATSTSRTTKLEDADAVIQVSEDEAEIARMIAEAAYWLAEKRNFQPGFEQEDWAAAKAEVMDKLKSR